MVCKVLCVGLCRSLCSVFFPPSVAEVYDMTAAHEHILLTLHNIKKKITKIILFLLSKTYWI